MLLLSNGLVVDGNEHVYVFGVNGLNMLCSGNFNGLMRHLRTHGYPNTYFGQLYAGGCFEDDIRKIRQTDPQARLEHAAGQ